jgi:hypothetical protein
VLAVNVPFFHRRRAERFAQLLDESGGARRHQVRSMDDQPLTDLVDVSDRLGRIDFGVQADPEFRTGLRAMLMATIEREGIGADAVEFGVNPEPVRRPVGAGSKLAWIPLQSRRARGAVVVGLAVGTLAIAGMSAMSGDTKPGDALYGMKRSAERAQLALSSSQLGRGQLYLEFAKTRINEAATGRGDVAGLLAEMDDETRQGVRLLTTAAVDRRDPTSLEPIDTFVAGQRHTMAGMLEALTGDARTRTIGSLQLLDDVKTRVDGLRQSLNCGDVTSSMTDDLGPVPSGCLTREPSPDSTTPAPADGSSARNRVTPAPGTGARVTSSTSIPTTTATFYGGTATVQATPASPTVGQQPTAGLLDRIAHLLGAG